MKFRFVRPKIWLTSAEYAESRSKVIAQTSLIVSLMFLAAILGFLSGLNRGFPYEFVRQVQQGYHKLKQMAGLELEWYYKPIGNKSEVETYQPGKMAPGLTLIAGIGTDGRQMAKLVDAQGKIVQNWNLDWFRLWPNATHIPVAERFNGPPGPEPHGVFVAPNGDLIFNLEEAGLFRINACNAIVWRKPLRTHHSIFEDEDGNLWIPRLIGEDIHDPKLPGYRGMAYDHRLIKMTQDGKVLKEWRLFDLLLKNDLEAELYMTSTGVRNALTNGDTLHLNDIDVFPNTMTPGTFKPGDVMISLRNLNLIVVFDPVTEKIIYQFRGPFIRQHDPDFVDGNTIRVYDNYNSTEGSDVQRSRILELYTDGRPTKVLFEGTKDFPFYSSFMGKEQILPNGNMLLTESIYGRGLEIDADGNPVWEYRNFYKKGVSALVTEAQRLAPSKDAAFFSRARAICSVPHAAKK